MNTSSWNWCSLFLALHSLLVAPENVSGGTHRLLLRASVHDRLTIVEEGGFVCFEVSILHDFIRVSRVNTEELVDRSWGDGLLIGVLAALDADNLRNALVGICVVVNIFST